MKIIRTFKKIIKDKILDLRMEHMALNNHQLVLLPDKRESFRYARLELGKAIIELKIAILRAIIGESK